MVNEEEDNQALAVRYHEDIFQKGNLEVADKILSPNFVIHNPLLPEELRNGPEGTKKYASAVITAIPDRLEPSSVTLICSIVQYYIGILQANLEPIRKVPHFDR